MRRILLAAIIAATLPLGAWSAAAADSTRTVPSFIAVNAKGAFTMTIEAGKTQSVKISGDDEFLNTLETKVVDNELQVTTKGKSRNVKGDPRVTITLPSLSRVKVEGAGQTIITGVASDRLDLQRSVGAGQAFLPEVGQRRGVQVPSEGVLQRPHR